MALDYRAIDQFWQVIDVLVCARRDVKAARRLFEQPIGSAGVRPIQFITDQAATYPLVLEKLLPATWHHTDQYANNRVECDQAG